MAEPTAELAAFASQIELAAVPAQVVAHAKLSVLDTLGCALHGSTLPWSRVVQSIAAEEGGAPLASVWGTAQRGSRTQAAWLNSTAGHAFEFDDVHMGGMIHVGSLTVPAAVAVAEGSSRRGEQLLAAVIAGCEVGARVGRAVGTPHFAAGYHPQGTVGVFAAAAAAGRMLGLDAYHLQHALGIAGSHAAGLMGAQRGAMTKRLHSGHACQSGVLAALLAARGFTGISDVLEVDFGGFCSTMGGGFVDLTLLTRGLGQEWETGLIGFKPFPSCAAAQSSIEAARLLREAVGLRAEDVGDVVVFTSEHARVHSGWPYEPTGVTAAQMSIGYGVARVLHDGAVRAAHFEEAAIADPEVLRLAAKVRVESDPELDLLGPGRRYAVRLRLTTSDGRVLTQALEDRPGNHTTPVAPELLKAKFADLAGGVLGTDASALLQDQVLRLEELDELTALTSALVPG